MSGTGRRAMELPAERAGTPAAADLTARRAGMAAALTARTAWRDSADWREETIAGVRCLRFSPRGAAKGLVLHLHGGGFRLGAPEQVGAFAAALAARCQVEVVCAAYRLAPEHPFPGGLCDARKVMLALAKPGGLPLIVSGDSAGGGLAAGLAALGATDQTPPAGLIALSPWLDMTVQAASYEANAATDPLFSLASARDASQLYLQGLSPTDPLASPLHGDLAGFPPTLVSVSSDEVLADDALAFHAALLKAGVKSTLCELPGMEHVAVTRDLSLTGAAETFEAVAAFVDGIVGRG